MTGKFAKRTGARRFRRLIAAGFTLAGAVLLVIVGPLIVSGGTGPFDVWLLLALGIGFLGSGVNLFRQR